MRRHNKGISELNEQRLKEDRQVRWAFREEELRIQVVEGFHRALRALGISQKELAQRSGTTQPMISRLLKGEDPRSPTLETLVKMADGLNGRLQVQFLQSIDIEDMTWANQSTVLVRHDSAVDWSATPRFATVGSATEQVPPAEVRVRNKKITYRTAAEGTCDFGSFAVNMP